MPTIKPEHESFSTARAHRRRTTVSAPYRASRREGQALSTWANVVRTRWTAVRPHRTVNLESYCVPADGISAAFIGSGDFGTSPPFGSSQSSKALDHA